MSHVMLPVEEYNKLIREVTRAECAIKVTKLEYSGQAFLEVTIDPHWLRDVALKKLTADGIYNADEFDIKLPVDMFVGGITIGKLKEPPSEE